MQFKCYKRPPEGSQSCNKNKFGSPALCEVCIQWDWREPINVLSASLRLQQQQQQQQLKSHLTVETSFKGLKTNKGACSMMSKCRLKWGQFVSVNGNNATSDNEMRWSILTGRKDYVWGFSPVNNGIQSSKYLACSAMWSKSEGRKAQPVLLWRRSPSARGEKNGLHSVFTKRPCVTTHSQWMHLATCFFPFGSLTKECSGGSIIFSKAYTTSVYLQKCTTACYIR